MELYVHFITLVLYALCSHSKEISNDYESKKTVISFMIDELKRQVDADNSFNYRASFPPDIESEYDFIIVGSGSAGSVLANRLSEVPEWKILLLEVGREATGFSDIPQLAPSLQFTDLNWGYLMEKQEGIALGMVNQRMAWPRGRALGGTSVINYMLNVRGNREDYNRWERMGNPGWSYKDVFQYFLKSEDAMIAVNDTGYHATGGYLSIQDVPYRTESAHAWVRASQEAGYKYVDYNGRQQLGVSYVQGTINRGRRCSAERAFLRTARDRPNLTILTEAWVTQVLIDGPNKQAYGVKYMKNGQYFTAKAKKEVILSAGAFNSPQLLILSGIGPRKHLTELEIPVVQDLPVGQKIYDHLTFLGLTFTVNESITTKTEDIFSINSFLQWKLGQGPHTGLGGVEAFTYIKAGNNSPPGLPDVELLFIGLSLNVDAGALIRKTFRISDRHFNQYWGPLIGKPALSVFPMLLHPKSYGYLKLTSKNPFVFPKLFGNFFTDPGDEDIKAFIASIREVQRIVRNSSSLKRFNATLITWPIPGCEKEIWDSDSYWECGLRHFSTTLHHQVTTCKMGPKEDPEAVVGHTLNVHGMKRLRVIDTSIFPTPIAAHISSPTYMIAEKASDMIKQEWGVKTQNE